MSFNWPYYLNVAQELADQAAGAPPELQEAKYRAAISRAYYAVFCRARHYLSSIDGISEPEYGNIHIHVKETFEKDPDKSRRHIGYNLDNMRQDRNAADYELDSDRLTNLSTCAQNNLLWAEEVLNLLDTIQKK
jgi:uncharacterized protein (UPF0332 family)